MEFKIEIDENEIIEKVTKRIVDGIKKDKIVQQAVNDVVQEEAEKATKEYKINRTIRRESMKLWDDQIQMELWRNVRWYKTSRPNQPAFYQSVQKFIDDAILDMEDEETKTFLLEHIAKNIAQTYWDRSDRRSNLAKELKRICEEAEE